MVTGVVVVWILSGILCAFIAQSKGRSVAGWAIAGILFGLFALIPLALLSSNVPQTQAAPASLPQAGKEIATVEQASAEVNYCSQCGARIDDTGAMFCKSCGNLLKQ